MYQVRDLNLGITIGPCQSLKFGHVTEYIDYFHGQSVPFTGGASLIDKNQEIIQEHAYGWAEAKTRRRFGVLL